MFTHDPAKREHLRGNTARPPVLRSTDDDAPEETYGTSTHTPLALLYGPNPQEWTPAEQLMNDDIATLIGKIQSQPSHHSGQPEIITAVAQIVDKHPECCREHQDAVRSSIEDNERSRASRCAQKLFLVFIIQLRLIPVLL